MLTLPRRPTAAGGRRLLQSIDVKGFAYAVILAAACKTVWLQQKSLRRILRLEFGDLLRRLQAWRLQPRGHAQRCFSLPNAHQEHVTLPAWRQAFCLRAIPPRFFRQSLFKG